MYRRLAALCALALALSATPAQAGQDRRIVLPCGGTKAKVIYRIDRHDVLRHLEAKNPCPDRWLVIWWNMADSSDSSADSVTVDPGGRFKWNKVRYGAQRFGASLKDTRPCPGNSDGTHQLYGPGYWFRDDWC
jgi:hypothetical protein